MKCDQCGYHPQKRDAAQVILEEGTDNLEVPIVYVRCYQCGHEWIE
jgi:uncharacterized Zn finger protein